MGINFGLSYTLNGIFLTRYLVTQAWGDKLYHMVLTYAMGFKALHGNGNHDNVTFVNYKGMGFGWIVDTRLASLIFLGIWGIPSL